MMSDDLTFKLVTIALLCVLAFLTTLINTICIYIIIKTKVLRQRPSTYFILNLLSVHLIQGLVVFPFYAAKKAKVGSLQWGQVICDGFRFSYMITFYGAIYGVLLISIDRVLATCWVWRYKEIVTKKRVIAAVVLFWIYIVALCLIPFGNHNNKKAIKVESKVNTTMEDSLYNINNTSIQHNMTNTSRVTCTYQQSSLWTILMLILNCMVPYVVIVLFYQIIIYKIRKMDKRSRSMTSYSVSINHNGGSHKQVDKKVRANTTLHNNDNVIMNTEDIKKHKHITHIAMILSVAYFFFWAPSVIYFILWSVCPKSCFTSGYKISKAEMYIGFITKYLAFLDALAAPLIYCIYHDEFRKLMPCKKFRKREESISLHYYNAYATSINDNSENGYHNHSN